MQCAVPMSVPKPCESARPVTNAGLLGGTVHSFTRQCKGSCNQALSNDAVCAHHAMEAFVLIHQAVQHVLSCEGTTDAA